MAAITRLSASPRLLRRGLSFALPRGSGARTNGSPSMGRCLTNQGEFAFCLCRVSPSSEVSGNDLKPSWPWRRLPREVAPRRSAPLFFALRSLEIPSRGQGPWLRRGWGHPSISSRDWLLSRDNAQSRPCLGSSVQVIALSSYPRPAFRAGVEVGTRLPVPAANASRDFNFAFRRVPMRHLINTLSAGKRHIDLWCWGSDEYCTGDTTRI